jgi:hypothetical protein
VTGRGNYFTARASASVFPNACPCAKDQTRAADGRPVQAKSASSYSSSHSSICVGAIVLFGRCGLSVPALTFGVPTNFALANFLASRSFGNVLVALTRFRFPRGSSNETYHVPLDLLAMIPLARATSAAHRRGPNLNRRLMKSFRLPPGGPQDSFSAVGGFLR